MRPRPVISHIIQRREESLCSLVEEALFGLYSLAVATASEILKFLGEARVPIHLGRVLFALESRVLQGRS